MDDTFAKLEAEYCPPLDPALLSAILSDFDLKAESDVRNARATLDPLKESALLEEEFGFDASGTGAQDEGLVCEARPESCPETSAALSRETDMTSVSNGLSSLDIEEANEAESSRVHGQVTRELEALDEDSKIQLLQEVFQNRVSKYNAQYTLRKCHGDWHKAMEELLTHVYFNEDGEAGDGAEVPKGIEAFSEDNVVRRGRKKKSKVKSLDIFDERRSSSLPMSPIEAPVPPTNKWKTASQDIEFIATRTGVATATVTSIYYASGASLAKAIANVLKDNASRTAEDLDDDPILAVNAHDLKTEFPTIAEEYVRTLIRLSHPSTAAAHELAKALIAQPNVARGGLQIVPIYARPHGDLADSTEHVPSGSRTPASTSAFSPVDASERAAAYSAARSAAYSQAYAAHRRAKSDRLMGGAAAYYGQVGREFAALSARATSAEADRLAETQSTSSQLDLHGVDVLNAVRIARDKVDAWWHGLGESRVNGRVGAEERHAGYRIVVGLGRHSEGGRSKLGPAVSKALREDGWKIEQTGAVILVTGRARR